MASWTPATVVSRSSTICEIDTFMTLLSSTITNWADARMAIEIHFLSMGAMVRGGVVSAAAPPTRPVR